MRNGMEMLFVWFVSVEEGRRERAEYWWKKKRYVTSRLQKEKLFWLLAYWGAVK